MPEEAQSQVINIEAPASDQSGADAGTAVAAGVAVESAMDSANAATVSVVAAESSAVSAEESAQAAQVSTDAAGVSVEAATQSQMTLQGLADLIEKLPERMSQMNQPPVQQAPPPVQEKAPVKEKPKKDAKPEQDHWYFKKRGNKR